MTTRNSNKYTIFATHSQLWFWLIIAAFIWAMSWLIPLTPDEREHAYATLLVSEGEIPYIDFFEHHHPLLWYISAPILWIMKENANAWYALRGLQAIILLITSFYIYKITILISAKKNAAYISILTYLSIDIVKFNGLEFRPDNLMVCLFISGLYYFFRYYQEGKKSNLSLSFTLFLLSFLSLQKAALLFVPPCLYLLIQSHKNRTVRTDVIISAIFPLIITLLLILFLILKNSFKDYFELNWILNILINRNMSYTYTPLTSSQINILLSSSLLSIGCLIKAKSALIKFIAATYILYGLFVYSWNIRHFQYMLPFYPLISILVGYTLSIICNNKKYSLIILTVLLFAVWTKHTYNTVQYLHHFKKNLSTYVMWDKLMFADTKPDDRIIYTTTGKVDHYFGGLKRQALDYYWFSIGGPTLLDYNTYHRHPYPNLRQVIRQRRPKIVINGDWDDCYSSLPLHCLPNQTLDKEYMQQHYINKGIYYLRID